MRKIQISQPDTGLEEWEATRDCFESGWLTQGPKVESFEKNFSQKHHVKHALAVTSCTTALHLALVALGLGPGDEVIVPAFTWVATANVVLYSGAKPIFVDVDPDTYNIDPKLISEKLSPKTKAIIPVHLFGLCADIEAIKKVIPKHVAVIEDAACAVGALYNGKFAGSLGDIAAFSFHPRKTMTTGEGGMVTTNDDQLAEIVHQMRNHGATISEEQRHHGPQPYLLPEFNLLGYNYRMTDLQGAVGLQQMQKLDKLLEERQKWSRYYLERLKDIEWLKLPLEPQNCQHAWQAFVCTIDPEKAPMPRNAIMEKLYEKGISTRPGTHALHTLGLYKKLYNFIPEDYPVAFKCETCTIALPLHNRMKKEDYDYIIEAMRNFHH